MKKPFHGYYNIKRILKEKYNVAMGLDYMFLNQYASFSFSDRYATSGIFRVYGTWIALKDPKKMEGSLIIKVENLHKIDTGGIPRCIGYETGANVYAKAKYDATPLSMAKKENDAAMIKLLKDFGVKE